MMKLVYPSEKYLPSYTEAYEEWEKNNITLYHFSEPEICVKKYKDYRLGKNLKPGRVPMTTYWLIDKGEFVGEISVRHSLTDALQKYGGHIGYGVRLSKQKQGYGTKMLSLALKKAKKMGLKRVLITCDDDNYGSAKVIENNGGVLQDVIKNTVDGKEIKTRRYWIEL